MNLDYLAKLNFFARLIQYSNFVKTYKLSANCIAVFYSDVLPLTIKPSSTGSDVSIKHGCP